MKYDDKTIKIFNLQQFDKKFSYHIYFILDALISRMATQQELDAGNTWTHGVHQEAHTRLEYEYRMLCSAHYYGKDCDTLCRPRDDQFGHYTCDANGDKICLDGWQKDSENAEGDYCTKGRHTYIFCSFTTGQSFSEHVNDFQLFCVKKSIANSF